MLGGYISGENHEANRRRLEVLDRDPTAFLYATLLGEALRETRPDFMYVRLWSLLEMIARSRNCAGRPLVDWSGVQQVSNAGRPIVIQHAREQVFELLRDLLAPADFSDASFAADRSFGTLSEQTVIWYRRRNCTTHGGDCECKVPGAGSGQAMQNCAAARADQSGPYNDPYLVSLRECTTLVVRALLW